MERLRTILAATDLSAPARHAVIRACSLAREVSAKVTLIHVLNRSALDDLRTLLGARGGPIEQGLTERAREELVRLAAGIGAPLGLAPEVQLVTGMVLSAIFEHAQAIDADLLVLGDRGESFMRHVLLGSTAERLLRKSLRPMLVVKQTPIERYRRLLIGIDFSPWSHGAVTLARTLAPHAELVLLHAFDVPFEGKLYQAGVDPGVINQYRLTARQAALKRLRELGDAAGVDPTRTSHTVLQGDPARCIIEQEQEQDCDLIVLGKHGANVVEELLLGSVTRRALAESSCDVLVSSQAAL